MSPKKVETPREFLSEQSLWSMLGRPHPPHPRTPGRDAPMFRMETAQLRPTVKEVTRQQQKLTSVLFLLLPVSEEEQETSGDFGSGGSVVLLDDLEDERELGPKDKRGKARVHIRAVTEDDEDEDNDKEDEVGYIW